MILAYPVVVNLTVVPSVENQYGKDTGACNPSADSIDWIHPILRPVRLVLTVRNEKEKAIGNLVEVDAGKGCSKLANGNMFFWVLLISLLMNMQASYISLFPWRMEMMLAYAVVVNLTIMPSAGNQYGKDMGACNPSADSIELDSSNPSTNHTCTCSRNEKEKGVGAHNPSANPTKELNAEELHPTSIVPIYSSNIFQLR
ncbi:hypothetical protein SADUNF_Sadunf12G0048700 [Salix dunnii]|uniref:Uncharacterized protein n=1 Tax=Salix dunnii TaxID=1413687 RepID=A0A835JHR0_9ROSI|nr:hypothetical protein SADUNF_Sadunf12G0048700 [Salix dunnii]